MRALTRSGADRSEASPMWCQNDAPARTDGWLYWGKSDARWDAAPCMAMHEAVGWGAVFTTWSGVHGRDNGFQDKSAGQSAALVRIPRVICNTRGNRRSDGCIASPIIGARCGG